MQRLKGIWEFGCVLRKNGWVVLKTSTKVKTHFKIIALDFDYLKKKLRKEPLSPSNPKHRSKKLFL